MKILKPNWVSHDGLPIYSVDIHPDGSRFATGGQGEDSGRVVIWNMAPVISRENEKNENIPKMLCQMDNHLACVNCVRWSASGKFLASAGDDRLVMIWKITYHQAGSNVVFGSSGGKGNVETWRCSSTLSGHTGDVLDLAWSPQDTWLASCSVDNNVIIWNAQKMPEIVAILKGHTGLVKGVVWDPVGKYIASQSDDKTLRIWRTADWKQDAVIQEPFEECGGTTYVLRLNWSPDGLYLVSAHAMNGGGPTALIIEREGWQQDKDFVGHRKAVTCVRFNSNILQKSFVSSSKPQLYCCCAIGSRDRSVSVWLTALKRPRVVIRDLFTNSVLDLSWSTSGLQLMACSWDGTVAYVEFTTEELGKCLSLEEKNAIHERMYGKSLATSACQSSIVENPELLGFGSKGDSGISAPVTNHVDSEEKPVVPQSPMKGPINKQIETRTSDGKRRITPMFIPPVPSGDVPVPFSSTGSHPTFSSSSEPKSRIFIEKRDDIVTPNVSQSPNKVTRPYQNHEMKSILQELPVESIQKSLSNSSTTKPANNNFQKNGNEEDCRFPFSKQICIPVGSENVQVNITQNICAAKEPVKLSLSRASLGQQMVIDILGSGQQVQVTNAAYTCKYGRLTTVRLLKKSSEEVVWTVMLGARAVAAAANRQAVVVACEDNCLHVLHTATGGRMQPTLVLASSPSRLVLSKQHVGVLTSCGRLSVWDVLRGRVVLSALSILPLLHGDADTVAKLWLTDEGTPLLALASGRAFLFSPDLSSWLLVGDKRDPVQCLSYHSSFTRPVQEEQWPLASLQGHAQTPSPATLSSARLFSGPAPSLCTLTHLEHQLATCRALHSESEYQFWFLTLVRFLVHEGLQHKLRSICDDLLGPPHPSPTWHASLMGREKHALLREVLDCMRNNLSLQRLYTEYNDQLLLKKHFGTE
ncbi:protein HIRA [Bacillus rossius redtenbacheri]|uniref:protein HIRA n=1 Tax=Bacillus rossius redtenbacheri TaxID=93214 RepID=UPI002FDEC9E1